MPRTVGLTMAALIAALGLPAPAASAVDGDTLYVNKGSANCSDSGPGSQDRPFCTIGAATGKVEPGQTVQFSKDTYYEDLRITRSGTPEKPITFLGAGSWVAGANTEPRRGLTVSGAHDVVIRNFGLAGALVENSSRITLDKSFAATSQVDIVGGNQDIAITRNTLGTLRVRQNSTGILISNNDLVRVNAPISVESTPGSTITNNTVALGCGPGIAVLAGSAGTRLYNNIIDSHTAGGSCGGSAAATELLVSPDSAAGSEADYNLLRAKDGGTPYDWNGVKYATPAEFNAKTAQGKNDLLGDPRMVNEYGGRLNDCTLVNGKPDLSTCSPAIDSARADAPGVLPTNIDGIAPVDDPLVDNRGAGYLDRGAHEVGDEVWGMLHLGNDQPQAPYGTKVNFTAELGNRWKGTLTYIYDFGDGVIESSKSPTVSHTYTGPCKCRPALSYRTLDGQEGVGGADTLEVTTPGPLTARLSTTAVLPTTKDWTAAAPFTVLADAHATESDSPWPVTKYSYDFGDGFRLDLPYGDLKHTYQKPGDYRVTVTATDSQGRTSTASQVFRARYEPGRYNTVKPFRLFDTRTGKLPVGPGVSHHFDLPVHSYDGKPALSAGMTAVVLNVTATNATQNTYLTVSPGGGQSRPLASNLNVKPGQTVANLVTVPVGWMQDMEVYNFAGSTDVIVDVVGYYQPDTGDRFTPSGPERLLDTRPVNGTPDVKLTPGEVRSVQVTGHAGVPQQAGAVVLNLTATGATKGGYVTAYPHGGATPGVSSLNFTAGQTVANQAIVPVGQDGKVDLYNFAGDTELIVDVFGYYSFDSKGEFTPVSPTRLTDTRPNGALGPAGQLAVQVGGAHDVPSDATAAVLNVTATGPTAGGFLTVWPDGRQRPGTSNLNFEAGQTVPNHVTTPLGGNGRADIYNHAGSTHVFADLLGYFTGS